jgi:hypothetical protein
VHAFATGLENLRWWLFNSETEMWLLVAEAFEAFLKLFWLHYVSLCMLAVLGYFRSGGSVVCLLWQG